MNLIDKTGTFRGVPQDAGVAETSGGFPQFVVKFRATQYYNEETEQWEDYTDVEENEIIAYLILFGGNGKETLTCKQVKKVFGWDGVSFVSLATADYSEFPECQFRVEENEYNGNVTLQVSWVDVYDAIPGARGINKLDANGLKALDAKYARVLGNTGTKTAAKAPTKGVTAKTVKDIKDKKAGPPARGKAAKAKTTDSKIPVGKCTMKNAWDEVEGLKRDDVTDEQLAEIWTKVVEEVAPGVDDGEITGEQWYEIKHKVAEETAVF